eukprot:14768179-Alexandrium_andersonii.AAC.1
MPPSPGGSMSASSLRRASMARCLPSGRRARIRGRRGNWAGSAARRHGLRPRRPSFESADSLTEVLQLLADGLQPLAEGEELSLIHISEPTRLALI